jgi:hypothetical protein
MDDGGDKKANKRKLVREGWIELTGVLADADDDDTEGEQCNDPPKGGGHAQVNFWPIHDPGAGKNIAQ